MGAHRAHRARRDRVTHLPSPMQRRVGRASATRRITTIRNDGALWRCRFSVCGRLVVLLLWEWPGGADMSDMERVVHMGFRHVGFIFTFPSFMASESVSSSSSSTAPLSAQLTRMLTADGALPVALLTLTAIVVAVPLNAWTKRRKLRHDPEPIDADLDGPCSPSTSAQDAAPPPADGAQEPVDAKARGKRAKDRRKRAKDPAGGKPSQAAMYKSAPRPAREASTAASSSQPRTQSRSRTTSPARSCGPGDVAATETQRPNDGEDVSEVVLDGARDAHAGENVRSCGRCSVCGHPAAGPAPPEVKTECMAPSRSRSSSPAPPSIAPSSSSSFPDTHLDLGSLAPSSPTTSVSLSTTPMTPPLLVASQSAPVAWTPAGASEAEWDWGGAVHEEEDGTHDAVLFPTLDAKPLPGASTSALRAALEASRVREERLRKEIELGSKECEVLKWRMGEDAAAWKRKEAELLAQIQRLQLQSHPLAVPALYRQSPVPFSAGPASPFMMSYQAASFVHAPHPAMIALPTMGRTGSPYRGWERGSPRSPAADDGEQSVRSELAEAILRRPESLLGRATAAT